MFTLVLGAVAAFLACTVGGLVGFATSLLLLPVLLLLGVDLWDAVALNLALAIVTRLPSVIALRTEVDVRRTSLMLAGVTPGLLAGLAVGGVVPVRDLKVGAGLVVVASGLHLLRAYRLERAAAVLAPVRSTSAGAALLTGASSGLLGVTTSLNGVPPAVLLARAGAEVRTRLADLSVFFVLGNVATLAALSAGRGVAPLSLDERTVVWLLAGTAGNGCGLWAARYLDRRRFDLLTIALVLLSGAASLVGAAA